MEYSACLSPLSGDFYMILRTWSVQRRTFWFKDNLHTSLSVLHTTGIFQPLFGTWRQMEYSACLSRDFYMILRNWSVQRRTIWFKDNFHTYAAILKICSAIGNINQSTVNLYYGITFLELPRYHALWSACRGQYSPIQRPFIWSINLSVQTASQLMSHPS